MPSGRQLDLLAGSELPDWLRWFRQRIAAWVDRGVFFGTSSWKYDGWLGQIYSPSRYTGPRGFSRQRFERECLAEYSETFSMVCGDFAFYQFYARSFWDRLFAQVPATFRFGFKVPEQITAPRFPAHPRYGPRAGQANPDFLNASLFIDRFLGPLEPHRSQVGYLVFEFPQFHQSAPADLTRFLEQLDQFLDRLPRGWPYTVEIRTRGLLGAEYFACLHRHGIGHAFNSWTRMPPIGEQLAATGSLTADLVVARALLRPGRAYQQAVDAFSPYRDVQDPWPAGYRDLARLVTAARAARPQAPVYLSVNNRFVGNAIGAIRAVLENLETSS